MKYATAHPYADPEKGARRILEIAKLVEPVHGRINIEKITNLSLPRSGKPSRVRCWYQTRDRARLAADARIPDLRHINTGRR
jgi:hypothetical protein